MHSSSSGPPVLRFVQGPLSSPIPVFVAAAGLALLVGAQFLPLAEYVIDGGDTWPDDLYLAGSESNRIMPDLGAQPGIVLLVLVAAATVAYCRSGRALLFGRFAGLGLSVLVIASELSRARTWRSDIQLSLEKMTSFEGASVVDFQFEYETGLWLLTGGLALLAVSLFFMRPARFAATQAGQAYPAAHHPPAQAPQQHPVPPMPHPEPAVITVVAEQPSPTVHDDPSSLSIYQRPTPRSDQA